MEKTSTKLRTFLESEEFFIKIGVGTAQQAQLAEKAGFRAVAVSGSNTNTIILGQPDAGLITMTELVENAERICRAVNVPVMVDCDTGFGNALNVRRTVDAVIRAGAAGLFIEDQVAPKRCGFVKGKEVISLEEAVGKYRAAIDVRDELDPDFIIMARCDARGAVDGSLEEVIRRAKAYLDAGVDIFYAEALQSRDEIKQVRSAIGECWFFCTQFAITPPLTQKEMQELGLCMGLCLIGQVGFYATYDFLMELKARGLDADNEFREKIQRRDFNPFDVAGFRNVPELEKKYLTPETLEKYDRSIGIYDPRVGHQSKT
jgi:2-methylisocitrate lyase-like PEP mutase family enzyme